MQITCDYSLCIYNEGLRCILNAPPHIDGNGQCSGILLPNIPEPVLERYKKELLEQYSTE